MGQTTNILVLSALVASTAGCSYRLGEDTHVSGGEPDTGVGSASTGALAPTRTASTSPVAIAAPSADPAPLLPSGPIDPALEDCGVDAETAARLEVMADALDDSVHEMIKCGQLQVGLAGNLMAILLTSNQSLFNDPTEYELLSIAASALGFVTDVPLERAEDGTWHMQVGRSGGSRFEIVFYDPDTGAPIVVDPFVIDSYLQGAKVDSSESLLDMVLHPSRRSTFTVSFESEGPLAHVLADGQPVESPFEVRLSLADLLDLSKGEVASPEEGGPDFGPLTSLSRLDMSSAIRLSDDQGDVTVRYDAEGMRDQLSVVANSGVGFELDALVAEDPKLTLRAEPSALQFLPGVGLSGRVELSLSDDATVRLESDYGSGTDRPTRAFSCE